MKKTDTKNIFDIVLETRIVKSLLKHKSHAKVLLEDVDSVFFQTDGIREFITHYKGYIKRYDKAPSSSTVVKYAESLIDDNIKFKQMKSELKKVTKDKVKAFNLDDIEFACDRLKELWAYRKFLGITKKYSDQIITGEITNPLALIAEAELELRSLEEASQKSKSEILSMRHDMDKVDEYITTMYERDENEACEVGIHKFDSTHKHRPGEMIIIRAPSGVGKSMFLCQIGRLNALKGKKVLIITIEMTMWEYFLRMCSGVLDIPIDKLLDGSILGEEFSDYKDKWKKTKKLFGKRFKKFDNDVAILDINDNASIGSVENYLDTCGTKYDVVILDYAADLKGVQKDLSSQHWQNQGENYVRFKNMCKKYNFIGFTAQQAKSGMNDRETINADEGAGSKIAGDRADVIYWITQTADDRMAKRHRIYKTKDRHAEDGLNAFVRKYGAFMRFEEIEDEAKSSEDHSDTEEGMMDYIYGAGGSDKKKKKKGKKGKKK